MSQEEGLNVSSAFPPPPPFYKHFTLDNLSSLKAHQKLGTPNDQLPRDLQFLIPPPPPTTSYRCFGDTWKIPDVLPSLPEMGITQLYGGAGAGADVDAGSGSGDKVDGNGDLGDDDSKARNVRSNDDDVSVDRAKELIRLSKSLLMNFLELVAVLGVNPSEFAPKIQDLRTILINMHHLINEYRPHQARETLILLMEEQLERCRKETEENRKACNTIRAIFDTIPGILGGAEFSEAMVAEGRENGEQLLALTSRAEGQGGGAKMNEKEEEARRNDTELWDTLREINLLS